MRSEFIEVETPEEADEAAPWACVVVPVEGGFRAFESVEDLRTWEAQL